jgi:hypothetical protein
VVVDPSGVRIEEQLQGLMTGAVGMLHLVRVHIVESSEGSMPLVETLALTLVQAFDFIEGSLPLGLLSLASGNVGCLFIDATVLVDLESLLARLSKNNVDVLVLQITNEDRVRQPPARSLRVTNDTGDVLGTVILRKVLVLLRRFTVVSRQVDEHDILALLLAKVSDELGVRMVTGQLRIEEDARTRLKMVLE